MNSNLQLSFRKRIWSIKVSLLLLLTISGVGMGAVATNAAPPNITYFKTSSPLNSNNEAKSETIYQIFFMNTGDEPTENLSIVQSIPDQTDYKLDSAKANFDFAGIIMSIDYSSDFDFAKPREATWKYTPVSAGGGASTGYDRNVKAVRWRVTNGFLSNVSPNNAGNVSFVTKIR